MPSNKQIIKGLKLGIEDVQMSSADLATRWNMNEGSIRMMRVEGRGPKYVTLGKRGRGRRPRVRYWLSDVIAFEQQHGRPNEQAVRSTPKGRQVSV